MENKKKYSIGSQYWVLWVDSDGNRHCHYCLWGYAPLTGVPSWLSVDTGSWGETIKEDMVLAVYKNASKMLRYLQERFGLRETDLYYKDKPYIP